MLDFECGLESVSDKQVMTVQRESVEGILSAVKSGISFDIAKGHTGVCIWEDNKVQTIGFALSDLDKNDNMYLIKLRHELRNKIRDIVSGKYFDVCQVEGVFGGENYDTSKMLIDFNGVVGELLLDGVFSTERYFNLSQREWSKYTRKIVKIPNSLKSKFETQEILKYLQFPFTVENYDKTEKYKESIFYEDICDATAMLCGVVLSMSSSDSGKSNELKISDIQMYYLEDGEDMYDLNDKVIDSYNLKQVTLPNRGISKAIISEVSSNENVVLCASIDNKSLGNFGIKHNFEFYEQGFGYLVFYNKGLKKNVGR